MGRFATYVIGNVLIGVGVAVTIDWYNTTKTKLQQQQQSK